MRSIGALALGESGGSPPLPWEWAGIPPTIQTPIENTEARAASRAHFTRIILRAKIGVYQNRNFNANWISRLSIVVLVIRPNAASPSVASGPANCGVFRKLKASQRN